MMSPVNNITVMNTFQTTALEEYPLDVFNNVTSNVKNDPKESVICPDDNFMVDDFANGVDRNGLKRYVTELPSKLGDEECTYYLVWKNELEHYLEKDLYDNNCIPEAETFLNATLDSLKNDGKIWINRFFDEYWEDNNTHILRALLATLAYVDYDKLSPVGVTMALAALSHEDIEVVQCAVQAFEGWGEYFGVKYLKHVHTSYAWLQKYISSVVKNLERSHSD